MHFSGKGRSDTHTTAAARALLTLRAVAEAAKTPIPREEVPQNEVKMETKPKNAREETEKVVGIEEKGVGKEIDETEIGETETPIEIEM